MKYHYIIFIIILISCQKEIEIETLTIEPSYVVHCNFSPYDSLDYNQFELELQSTQHINSQTPTYVENAIVIVSEENNIVDTLKYSSALKKYIFQNNNFNPSKNKSYALEVMVNTAKLAAQTTIPKSIEILETTLTPNLYKDEDGAAVSEVGITFQDPVAEDNYYEIVFENYPVNFPVVPIPSYKYQVSSNDEAITSENYYPTLIEFYLDKPTTLLFSDKTFNGELKTFSITAGFLQGISDIRWIINQEVKIVLRHVTEDYYLYKTKMYDHLYTQEEDILYGIGEPQELRSNISGGLGIFGSYSSYVNIMKIDSTKI